MEITEEEKSKIGMMRVVVRRSEEADEAIEEVNDWTMRRFLRAREMHVDKAANMMLKWWHWKRSFLPNGLVSEAEIAQHLSHNKLFMQGLDRTGRPIVVVFGGRHKQTNVHDFKRYVVYTLEKICAGMPVGQEKFTSIADLQGWGYSNSDIRGYLAALSVLQDCYPERLGKLFMVHVPSVFMAAWKMVYPFVDANTKKKIIFVEDKKLTSTLLNDIDHTQLPQVYGGSLPLVPIQNC